MVKQQEEYDSLAFASPIMGQAFTIVASLFFLFLSMILGIVGPAAAHGSGSPGAYQAPWFAKNYMGFVGIVVCCLVFSGLAIKSKLERRKNDNSPLPYWSIGMALCCAFLLVSFVTGLLAW